MHPRSMNSENVFFGFMSLLSHSPQVYNSPCVLLVLTWHDDLAPQSIAWLKHFIKQVTSFPVRAHQLPCPTSTSSVSIQGMAAQAAVAAEMQCNATPSSTKLSPSPMADESPKAAYAWPTSSPPMPLSAPVLSCSTGATPP